MKKLSHKQKLLNIIEANGDCSSIYHWKGCDCCPIDFNICKSSLSDTRKEAALKIYKAYHYNINDLFEALL